MIELKQYELERNKTKRITALLRSSMGRRRLIARHTILSLVFAVIYLLLTLPKTIGLAQLGSSTWYPANGLVLALLLGVSPWYGVLVAFCDTLTGALVYHQPVRSFGETLGPAGLACWYAAAAYLLRGPWRIDLNVIRGRDVVRYLAVTTGAALGATVTGVACLAADHTIPWGDFWHSAPKWFVGDEIGLLGLAPFLLIHAFPWVRRRFLQESLELLPQTGYRAKSGGSTGFLLLEGIGQASSLVAVLWIMLWPGRGNFLFLSFIPILWMAMRQGVARVTTGLVGFTFGMVLAMHLSPSPQSISSRIGVLMLVVSAAGLVVGSAVTERHLMETDLRERTAYLNSLIENSPLGIVVLSREGRVELVNEAFTKLFLFENRSELVGSNLDELLPGDSLGQAIPWSGSVIAGQTGRFSTWICRQFPLWWMVWCARPIQFAGIFPIKCGHRRLPGNTRFP
jgi:PAS domain-containing protein